MWKWGLLAVVVVGVGAGLVWARVGKTTGDYVEHTIQQTDFAGKRAAALAAQNKVKDYFVQHGAYPATLDDLEGIPDLPEGWTYDYDPTFGKVDVVRGE